MRGWTFVKAVLVVGSLCLVAMGAASGPEELKGKFRLTVLSTLPALGKGPAGTNPEAMAVNAAGQITGVCIVDGVDRAFLVQGGKMTALPTLLVYVLAGQYFVRGMMAGAVKG